MAGFLQSLGQWVVAAACVCSGYFVVATTFLEYFREGLRVWNARIQFFRWWKHELTTAQAVLDICLFITLLPEMLLQVFGLDFLGAKADGNLYKAYVITGLILVAAVTIWRADATSRIKARERVALHGQPAGQDMHQVEGTPETP